MNTKTIELTEQSIYQIKNLLINDEVIRRLLYIQTPNALTVEQTVSAAQVDNLISIIPYVEDEGGIENSSQSNFIVVYPSLFDFNSDIEHIVNLSIDIFVYKDYYLLDGSKMRITQIINRILKILENKKLSFAEKVTMSDSRLVSIDKGKTLGYITTWRVANGTETQY
jgi:hypothetical protein